MKIKVKEVPIKSKGAHYQPGDVAEVDDFRAQKLIKNGKAERVADEVQPETRAVSEVQPVINEPPATIFSNIEEDDDNGDSSGPE